MGWPCLGVRITFHPLPQTLGPGEAARSSLHTCRRVISDGPSSAFPSRTTAVVDLLRHVILEGRGLQTSTPGPQTSGPRGGDLVGQDYIPSSSTGSGSRRSSSISSLGTQGSAVDADQPEIDFAQPGCQDRETG